MKTIPPSCPEPESGRQYWRSLDHLAETPEFQQWLEREFPQGASEWTDPVSRRHFVKIMSASFLLAGFGLAGTGCRRPESRILPFAKMPENYIHGVPQFYATAMPTRSGALPLVVRSNEGRPTKVEGNNTGTDRFAQASILNLYDPDRATRFMRAGNTAQPAEALQGLAEVGRQSQTNGGKGLCILAERSTSPTRHRLQQMLAEKLPQSRWFTYDPVDSAIHRRAAKAAFGSDVEPYPDYANAQIILSLDCDFIGNEENVHNSIRGFAQNRDPELKDQMNRLYAVESLMTLTGMNADHRLRLPASAIIQIAAAIAAEVGVSNAAKPSLPDGVDPAWIKECAADLARHKGRSLVVAGTRQPQAVHLLAHAINAALGNIGKTVHFHRVPALREGNLADLAQALNSGQVETLVILGGNPVYTAPSDLDWAKTQRKAKTIVRLSYYEDETTALTDLHLPEAHYLESWGDALTATGVLVPVQPLIEPLFGGLTEIEVLARLLGLNPATPYELVRETFKARIGQGDMEATWKRFLHDGMLTGSGPGPVNVQFNPQALAQATQNLRTQAPSKDSLELVFHRDYSLDDGRYNNNGWLQELPDPVTKITWDNVVLMSRKTAVELGVQSTDLVEISFGGNTIQGPAWVQPGMADYSLGLALGYGREKTGRVGHKTGFNVYPLRRSGTEHIALGATVKAVGKTYPISCTQDHWSLEGRPIIREASLEQFQKYPDFARRMNLQEPPVHAPLYPNPLEKLEKIGLHQWGMSIDLNRCVGCSACVLACQSENNVPIVGKDQVKRGREMHWLRIDRYYSGNPKKRKFVDSYKKDQKQQHDEWVDDPQTLTQPMLCQHCEAAPCENVCPVNATVHDQEGLNVMVYNRCVGTRYCSNNCPYKVRRFNYFDYNKRPITELYKGPFGQRKSDEWDLLKMIKNPDVTVRMRGIMEKCTFCIQRIESAKIQQKNKAGGSGDVVIPTDSFTTACASACSSQAIVFGNLNDPNSRVSRLKTLERDYTVLEFLLTRPRTTYLARVRNMNPAMPDYDAAPLSFQLYEEKMGDPFKVHDAGHGGHASPEQGATKGAH